jgi:hypothetical protein
LQQSAVVSAKLVACGDENALAFSVAFDPARLSYQAVQLGTNADGSTLNVNAVDANAGRIGFVLALPVGRTFDAGTAEVLKVSFQVKGTGTNSLAVTDEPVLREIVNADASSLVATYVDGSIVVPAVVPEAPALRASHSADKMVLAWPASVTGCVVEQSSDLSSWSPVNADVQVAGEENVVELPISAGEARFYRLRVP